MKRRHFFKTLITAVSTFTIASSETIAINTKYNNVSATSDKVLGLSTITIAAELFCIDPDCIRPDTDSGIFEIKEDENVQVLFMVKNIENKPWSNNLVKAWFTDEKRYKSLIKDFTRIGSWIISGMYTIEKDDEGKEWLEFINPVYQNYSQMIENQYLI